MFWLVVAVGYVLFNLENCEHSANHRSFCLEEYRDMVCEWFDSKLLFFFEQLTLKSERLETWESRRKCKTQAYSFILYEFLNLKNYKIY